MDTSGGTAETVVKFPKDEVTSSGWGHLYIPLSQFKVLQPGNASSLYGLRFFTDYDDKFLVGAISGVEDRRPIKVQVDRGAPNVQVNEAVQITATAPAAPTVPNFSIDFGDGSAPEAGGQLLVDGKTGEFTVTHYYKKNGTYTITVTATDKTGVLAPGSVTAKVAVGDAI
jgi:PKD domain